MKARGRCREARQVNHSAEGAKYESQGQARSASPLVKSHQTRLRPEGPEYRVPYYALFRADALLILLPGATRFALAPGYHIPRLWRFYACPWLSHWVPLALTRYGASINLRITRSSSMLNDKRWQSPHFWAAFTLQGEWR